MSESNGEIQLARAKHLSSVEQHQAFTTERGSEEAALQAVSGKRASEPGLHRELIHNPYSPTSLGALERRFPEIPVSDAIKALVLAEPVTQYDRDLVQLSREQQIEAFYNQIDVSASTKSYEVNYKFIDDLKEYVAIFRDEIESVSQMYEQVLSTRISPQTT